MKLSAKLDQLHLEARSNKWLNYFALSIRLALAIGFIFAGFVKVVGARFAAGLSTNHPMGQYLEALHHTGYYYTFIGVVQIIAALLLLIPRTVTLGALCYFPVILNIFVLSYAVRFEGSSFTSPLMVLGCLFLICWNYDKIKYILPFDHSDTSTAFVEPKTLNSKFPVKFFLGVATTIATILCFAIFGWKIAGRNNLKDCNSQFTGTKRTNAGATFCNCIHQQGMPLDKSIQRYENEPDDL